MKAVHRRQSKSTAALPPDVRKAAFPEPFINSPRLRLANWGVASINTMPGEGPGLPHIRRHSRQKNRLRSYHSRFSIHYYYFKRSDSIGAPSPQAATRWLGNYKTKNRVYVRFMTKVFRSIPSKLETALINSYD